MAEALPGLTGYVLAGGRSSRMGQNKAAMRLGNATLLETAVRKLRRLCAEVVVIGGDADGGADRVVADRHPGCGPLGGIEAALGEARGQWAMFLPVDMPLLPAGLVAALGAAWSVDTANGARVAMAVADGVVQPLVSLVHREVQAAVNDAMARRQYKVQPVLQQAVNSLRAAGASSVCNGLCRTEVRLAGDGEGSQPGTVRVGCETLWQPSAAEWQYRHLWFSNLNTAQEFVEAEQAASRVG